MSLSFMKLSPKLCLSMMALMWMAFVLGACASRGEIDWVFAPADGPVLTPIPENGSAAPLPTPNATAIHPPGQTMILAHFMTWFKTRDYSGQWQHWQWDPNGNGQIDPGDSLPDQVDDNGRHQIAAVAYPLIGPYDSADPAVIEYQIASAWAAGIDGFVVDWYGPQDGEGIDRAFARTLDTVDQWRQSYGLAFFVGLNYEGKILMGVDPADREAALTAHLTKILGDYARRPAYLTYRGLPVIFYFEAWQNGKPGLLTPKQLAHVRQPLPPHYLLYMGAEAEFFDVTNGFFSWVSGANADPLDWGQDYANWVFPEMDSHTRTRTSDLTVGSVWSGFDDSPVDGWGDTPRFIDPQNGAVYEKTWDLALNAKAQAGADQPAWVQIVTWNDWNEGTQIEPTLADGTALLAATQDKARAYTGRDMPPAALEIPPRILALRRATPGPETEALIRQVYAHFFAGEFAAALSLLEK